MNLKEFVEYQKNPVTNFLASKGVNSLIEYLGIDFLKMITSHSISWVEIPVKLDEKLTVVAIRQYDVLNDQQAIRLSIKEYPSYKEAVCIR